MTDHGIESLKNHQYISLATFRRNGEAVKTPLWFEIENGIIYAYTEAGSGKTKRIRNNPNVEIAPCTMKGAIIGEVLHAHAVVGGPEMASMVHGILKKKYTWKMWVVSTMGAIPAALRLRKPKGDEFLKITLVAPQPS